jgi:hypothetical protein
MNLFEGSGNVGTRKEWALPKPLSVYALRSLPAVKALLCEAAERGSRFNAASLLRDRVADTAFFLRLWPRLLSRAAALRVFSDTLPFFGGARSTPARRALERPMATACLAAG